MANTATSIKIPADLKERIDRLARRSLESSHAYMVRALECQVAAAERYESFLQDGVSADEAMLRSGLGYAAEQVHRYLDAKVGGRGTRKPRPVRWRE